jgi:hypothetical protein
MKNGRSVYAESLRGRIHYYLILSKDTVIMAYDIDSKAKGVFF